MRYQGRTLGWIGYAKILRSMQRRPIHAVDLVEKMLITRETARRVLLRMHELGACHIVDWAIIGKARTAIPVYRYGPGNDAPGTTGKPGGWPRDAMAMHNRLPELTHFLNIVKLLAEPITAKALAEEVGANHSNILAFIRKARKIKFVRVADWDRTRFGPVAMFAIGSNEDRERPPPMTQKEINERFCKASRDKARMLRMIHALAANSEQRERAA